MSPSPRHLAIRLRGFALLALLLFPSCRSAFLLVDVLPRVDGESREDLELVYDLDRLEEEGVPVERIPGPSDEAIVEFALAELGLRGSDFQVVSARQEEDAVAALISGKREDGTLRTDLLLAARVPRGSRRYALLEPLPGVDLATTGHSVYFEGSGKTWGVFGLECVDAWNLRASFSLDLDRESLPRSP